MSADEELGIVYMPVELPTGDYYGGHRHGAARDRKPNLYRREPGRARHQDRTEEMALPAGAPRHLGSRHSVRADPDGPGRRRQTGEGRAQPTKQNWLYVFDRVTGKPVWPIVEKPVEKGDVPGEWYSPTQPFVTKPPAYERQGVTINDLIDYTPELRAEAEKLVSAVQDRTDLHAARRQQVGRPARHADVAGRDRRRELAGADRSIRKPSAFTSSPTSRSPRSACYPPTEGQSDMLFGRGVARNPNPAPAPAPGAAGGGGGGGLNVRGLPLVKPPYATITAIDMNKGEQLWRIAHGDTPDNIKNNPR
jgi:quinoprotein glucose dehydrogenase